MNCDEIEFEPPRGTVMPKKGDKRTGLCEGQCGTEIAQTYSGWSSTAFWTPVHCPECQHKAHAERKKREEAERLLRARTHCWTVLNVPPMYDKCRLNTFKKHGTDRDQRLQQRMLDRAQEYIDGWPERANLTAAVPLTAAFIGPPGTGKSHFTFGIAHQLIKHYQPRVLRVKFPDLYRAILDTYDDRKSSEGKVLKDYRDCDLLIIDEVSEFAIAGAPDKKQPLLYSLVDHREEWLRPTILTSNDFGDETTGLLGERLVDRINRHFGVWEFTWSSYRKTMHAENKAALKVALDYREKNRSN